jgi:hypothetical protein
MFTFVGKGWDSSPLKRSKGHGGISVKRKGKEI